MSLSYELPYPNRIDQDKCKANGLDIYISHLFDLISKFGASREIHSLFEKFEAEQLQLLTSYHEYETAEPEIGFIHAAFYFKLVFATEQKEQKGDVLFMSVTKVEGDNGQPAYFLNGSWNDVVEDHCVLFLHDTTRTCIDFVFAHLFVNLGIFKPALLLEQLFNFANIFTNKGIAKNTEYQIENSGDDFFYVLEYDKDGQNFNNLVQRRFFVVRDDERIETVLTARVRNDEKAAKQLTLALVCPNIDANETHFVHLAVDENMVRPHVLDSLAKELLASNLVFVNHDKMSEDISDLDMLG